MRPIHFVAALGVATLATLPARAADPHDCSLTYLASVEAGQIIDKSGFGFDGYDKLCQRLRAEGMGVHIIEQHGTIGDQAYSWVSVTMYSRKLEVDSDQRQSSTTLGPAKGADVDAMFMDNLNSTLDDISKNPDEMVKSAHEEDERVTKVVREGAKP